MDSTVHLAGTIRGPTMGRWSAYPASVFFRQSPQRANAFARWSKCIGEMLVDALVREGSLISGSLADPVIGLLIAAALR